MNSTGPVKSWNINPIDVGPIYPFVGWEMLMFASCVVFCAVFLIWKFLTENSKYADKARRLRQQNELENVLGAKSPGKPADAGQE